MYGLTKQQMANVFQYMRAEYIKEDIREILFDATYVFNGKEINSDVVAERIDLDYIAERFIDKDEFNWSLLEDLIAQEVSENEEYILTGKRE